MLSRYLLVVVVTVLLIAGVCRSALAQTEEEMSAVVQAMNAAFNAHDVEQYVSYFTDDVITDYVPFPPPMEGKEAAAAFVGGFFHVFPDITASTQRILTSGNILVHEWIATATQQAEFLGIPPTGKGGPVPHFSILEFEGDKVKKATTYLDYVTVLVLIGAMPASELPPLEPSFELPDPEPTGLSPVEAALEIAGFYDAHDLVNYAKRFRADAEILVAPLGITVNRDVLMGLFELEYLGFSDMKHQEIVRAVDLGDGWVLEEVIVGGTHDGPYFGIPASNVYNDTRVGALLRIDADGLVTNVSLYWDELGTLIDIGAVPAPGTTSVSPSTWGQIKATFQE